MAQPSWLKKYLTFKPEVTKLFDDLENYRNFCVEFGHCFNEADLYNEKSPYGDFIRYSKGKPVRDNWSSSMRGIRNAPRTLQ